MPSGYSPRVQVGPQHYDGTRYDTKARFASYWHQIDAVLRHNPETVLEVGPGNGVVTAYLRRLGVRVITLDIDARLRPDLLARVDSIPLPDGAVDVALCCQVLEHMPYDRSASAVRELRRVVRAGAVISVPDVAAEYRLFVGRKRWGGLRLATPRPWARMQRQRHNSAEHFWELGVIGFPTERWLATLRDSGFAVERHYRVFENPYHHFFELDAAASTAESHGQ